MTEVNIVEKMFTEHLHNVKSLSGSSPNVFEYYMDLSKLPDRIAKSIPVEWRWWSPRYDNSAITNNLDVLEALVESFDSILGIISASYSQDVLDQIFEASGKGLEKLHSPDPSGAFENIEKSELLPLTILMSSQAINEDKPFLMFFQWVDILKGYFKLSFNHIAALLLGLQTIKLDGLKIKDKEGNTGFEALYNITKDLTEEQIVSDTFSTFIKSFSY